MWNRWPIVCNTELGIALLIREIYVKKNRSPAGIETAPLFIIGETAFWSGKFNHLPEMTSQQAKLFLPYLRKQILITQMILYWRFRALYGSSFFTPLKKQKQKKYVNMANLNKPTLNLLSDIL